MKKQMTICLWFDDQAEQAARHYVSIFNDSVMGRISRYGKEGFEFHQRPEGTVMIAEFTLNGMQFIALNGGPVFKFNEAMSIVVNCDSQDEIDYYWAKLTEGGEEGQCGWLKDKYGVSWQIVPSVLSSYMTDEDHAKTQRVTAAFLQMTKFDIAALQNAYKGNS